MGKRVGIGRDVLKRRGLLAGAVALAGAGLAKLTGPGHAEAAHTAPEDVLHADVVNTTTGTTEIHHTGATGRGLLVRSTNGTSAFQATVDNGRTGARGVSNGTGGIGVDGWAGGGFSYGVHGSTEGATTNASGVKGIVFAGATNGVWGENYSSTDNCDGVFGVATASTGKTVGVWGRSQSGTAGATGTLGEATASSGATTGVLGQVSSPAGIAVRGNGGSGVGVFGGSSSNIGVYADSGSSTAVYATSTRTAVWGRSVAGTGVFGQSTDRGVGVYGASAAPGWAGYFEGNVYVTGRVVQAGAAASAATAADGSTRAVYSVDSAEPLVEDVGEAKLTGGRAEVKLDPDFAALVTSDTYMVFLTEEGDHNALFVEKKTPAGFTVRAKDSPTAASAFSYRVVAKRKGATGKRLEKLERPKGLQAKDLEPPKLPEAVAPPEKPAAESKPERRDTP